MIKAENISFCYGKKQVLNDVSAQFHKGEICCVLGVNGCGKTTLLKLLGRRLKAQSGTLSLDGRDYDVFEGKEFAAFVSSLPQSRTLLSIRAEELVAHGRYPYLGFSRRLREEDKAAVEKAIELTGIAEFRDKNVNALSGGERQRVYIAMLLAQNTPYVLLDEPTTFLDIRHAMDITRLMTEMKTQGKGVVAVMHDLPSALKIADRILLLDSGRVAFSGSADELLAGGYIEKVFSVRCRRVEGEYFFE